MLFFQELSVFESVLFLFFFSNELFQGLLQCVAVLFRCLGVKFQYVHGSSSLNEINQVYAYIRNTYKISSFSIDGEPKGLFLGSGYAGYISCKQYERVTYYTIYLYYLWYIKPTQAIATDDDSGSITRIFRTNGDRTEIKWGNRTVQSHKPTTSQEAISEDIINMAKTSQKNGYSYNTVVYLHGPSGCGKSTIADIIGEKINAKVCSDHRPDHPGDYLDHLITRANPSKTKPLIVVINEFDDMVDKFDHPVIAEKSDVQTRVTDESTFHDYLDRLSDYENCLFIFTGNKHIDKLNPVTTRTGRISKAVEMKHDAELAIKISKRFL